MRLGRYSTADSRDVWPGIETDGEVVNLNDVSSETEESKVTSIRSLLQREDWEDVATEAIEAARQSGKGTYPIESVTRQAPIAEPQKIIAVGLNYADHAEESGNTPPEEPLIFAKFPQAITGPDTAIRWDPSYTTAVDYEAELVAVIGTEARSVGPDEAQEHIAGYTIGNDISGRDLQGKDEQWVRAKSLDTFAPIGPTIVPDDEISDVSDLDIWTEVNGSRVQDSNTSEMLFDVADLVSFCSEAFTLKPGDLIFTGTPAGIGYFRDPQVLLENGDTVTVGIDEVGTLRNDCQYEAEPDT
ncbi:fumarylacetoacetate hydrolase family protein [Halobellus sp. GM3]|uniref:fumarylacetoacetate hydrolase family protein n=1 Tax=Halobellus sp. GM3 TaxID=3458410 RepID=UPI00403DC44C